MWRFCHLIRIGIVLEILVERDWNILKPIKTEVNIYPIRCMMIQYYDIIHLLSRICLWCSLSSFIFHLPRQGKKRMLSPDRADPFADSTPAPELSTYTARRPGIAPWHPQLWLSTRVCLTKGPKRINGFLLKSTTTRPYGEFHRHSLISRRFFHLKMARMWWLASSWTRRKRKSLKRSSKRKRTVLVSLLTVVLKSLVVNLG